MRTGRFVWRPTGPWRPVSYTHPAGGPPPLDYTGLNYYSRCVRNAQRITFMAEKP